MEFPPAPNPDATTDSRRQMLDRLRTRPMRDVEPPAIDLKKMSTFQDPIAHFQTMLQMVGGESHLVDDVEQVGEFLAKIPAYASANRIASVVPGIDGSFDPSVIDDPHALSTLDWTIASGDFMVAENGAIWVEGETLPHRVMLFIAQYLAIVVPREQIVNNMHEAYARIEKPKSPFGVFVAGPSKTADIEQSLVLGAHGCRKLQVFLV